MMRRLLVGFVFVAFVSACNPTIVAGSEAPLASVTGLSRQCGGAPAYQRSRNSSGEYCLTWMSHQFVWQLGPLNESRLSEESFRSAVRAAVQSWKDAASSCSDLTFAEGPAGNGMVGNDGMFQIITRAKQCETVVSEDDACWSDFSCGRRYNCWDHDKHISALTTTFFSKTSGVILDSDTEINEADFFVTVADSPPCNEGMQAADCVAFDLQATVTHEVGHALGLAHSSEGSGVFSTMSPTANFGDIAMRRIDASSACFVCDVYPAGLPSRACQQ